MINLTDVIIKCGCGMIASENEFMPNGETGEHLVCPECGDTASLEDFSDD